MGIFHKPRPAPTGEAATGPWNMASSWPCRKQLNATLPRNSLPPKSGDYRLFTPIPSLLRRAMASRWLSGIPLWHLAEWAKPGRPTSPIHGRPLAGWRMEQTGPALGGSAGDRGWAGESYHRPIMAEEVCHFLQPSSGKLILDGTLGGAGHTELFLQSGAEVIGLDRDPDAILRARERLEPAYGQHFTGVKANFSDFPDILTAAGIKRHLDGIFLDLGVSSRQLENPGRGFSFLRDGPLDMRLDPDAPLSAEDVINTWTEEELARIFRDYGEEPAARRLARTIAKRREVKAIRTTLDFADLVASVIPKKGRTHPATRAFQSVRIAVNDELGSLERALTSIPDWLCPGGRLVILTFHSLEDRIVKTFLRAHSQPEIDKPEWPAPRPNPDYHFHLVIRKPVSPSESEIATNPRARSCKLRVAERLGVTASF